MKNLFDLQQGWVYLDNAASTPHFKYTLEKVIDFLKNYGSIHRGYSFMSQKSSEEYEKSRELIKKILNAPPHQDLVFVQNTTDGINKLSLMLNLSDKNIAVSDIEHSANFLPWKKRAKNVFFIKTDEGFRIDLDHLEKVLKEKDIYILSLALASNVSGVGLNKEELSAIRNLCDKYNTLFFLDAAQAVAHFKLDLQEIKCDAIVFAGHKMYAPFGGGAIIANKEILSNTYNSVTGGGNVKDIIDYEKPELIYQEVPLNQEVGTPNGVGAISLAASLDFIYNHISMEEIEKHNSEMIEFFDDEMKEIDILKKFNVKKKTPILLIEKNDQNIKNLFSNKIAFREGHFCVYNFMKNKINQNNGVIRLSAGLTTSLEDLKKVKNILLNKS